MQKMQNLLLLTGGASGEHDVSVASCKNIISLIDKTRYNIISILIQKDKTWISDDGDIWHLHKNIEGTVLVSDNGKKIAVDIVFPLVLGDVEDGSLPGYFQSLDTPFVGSKLLASAIGFDKICAKRLLQSYGIDVVPFVEYSAGDTYESLCTQLQSKSLFVKASRSGSSLGAACVRNQQQFEEAIANAQQYDQHILIEKHLNGVRELFCCILEDLALPKLILSDIAEAIYSTEFYDYEAKYSMNNSAEKKMPADISDDHAKTIKDWSAKIFRILRCNTFLRVDLFLHENKLYFSEVNTMPAMTPTSLYLKIMEKSGYESAYVINKLIEQASMKEELCF